MEKTKNVFISHYSQDEENIEKMKKLLSDNGYQIKNSSIDSTKPNEANNEQYIKSILSDRIDWAGTFICLIGTETHTRPWVNWEIEHANRKDKRIIGVFINGASDSNVPESFQKYGDALVGWTGEKIIDAINGKINNWENPDGSLREPFYRPNRGNCG